MWKRPKKGSRDMNRKKFIAGLVALGTAPAAAGSLLSILPAHAADEQRGGDTASDLKYTANEITEAGSNFFGITTEAMAKAVQHVFGDLGEPDAYIKGDEGSGAFVVGFRYGSGWLVRKAREPKEVYWRGASGGVAVGGDAPQSFSPGFKPRDAERG